MDDSFEVIDGVPDGWAELTTGGPRCLKPEWLAYESARLPGALKTFVLRSGGRISVATVGTVVEKVGVRRFADPYRLLHEGFPGRSEPTPPWADLPPEEVLPCALLMAPEYELALTGPDADDPARVKAFVDGLLDWAHGAGVRSVVAAYLDPSGTPLADALVAAGFESSPLADFNVMRVDWLDRDGYVEALKRRRGDGTGGLRRRHNEVGRELRRLAELPVDLGVRALGPDEPELVELLMEHARRYGTPQTAEGARLLLARILDLFGADRTLVVTASHEGRLIAFSLLVRDGTSLVAVLAGTRYDAAYASESHFGVYFYEVALQAPRLGVTEVVYGLGDDRTKTRRGCEQVEMRIAFTRLKATR